MTNKSKSEIEKLIRDVIRCDATAQREMYDLLVLKMYNTVYRILKNKEDTQDCLQVGFGILFRKLDLFDPKKGAFNSWVTRIFINAALQVLRKNKFRFEEINDSLIVPINAKSPIENLEAKHILEIINLLPDQMRLIFNLYEIEGYAHKEIAEILNIAESSCRTYLMRAKVKLRMLVESSISTENERIAFLSNKRSER